MEIMLMGGYTVAIVWATFYTTAEAKRSQIRRLRQELKRAEEVADVLTQVSYEQEAEIAALKFAVGRR